MVSHLARAQAKGTPLKIICRIRPFLPGELQPGQVNVLSHSGNTVTITEPEKLDRPQGQIDPYKFSTVLPPTTTQDEAYAALDTETGLLCQGVSMAVMAYGITGSGKTYTIQGSDDKRGILPRLLRHIFQEVRWTGEESPSLPSTPSMTPTAKGRGGDRVSREGKGQKRVVRMSVYEMYNGRVYDLLSDLPKARPCDAVTLGGRTVAVDFSGVLVRYMITPGISEGPAPHLLCAFRVITRCLALGMAPIIVLDNPVAHPLKKQTQMQRALVQRQRQRASMLVEAISENILARKRTAEAGAGMGIMEGGAEISDGWEEEDMLPVVPPPSTERDQPTPVTSMGGVVGDTSAMPDWYRDMVHPLVVSGKTVYILPDQHYRTLSSLSCPPFSLVDPGSTVKNEDGLDLDGSPSPMSPSLSMSPFPKPFSPTLGIMHRVVPIAAERERESVRVSEGADFSVCDVVEPEPVPLPFAQSALDVAEKRERETAAEVKKRWDVFADPLLPFAAHFTDWDSFKHGGKGKGVGGDKSSSDMSLNALVVGLGGSPAHSHASDMLSFSEDEEHPIAASVQSGVAIEPLDVSERPRDEVHTHDLDAVQRPTTPQMLDIQADITVGDVDMVEADREKQSMEIDGDGSLTGFTIVGSVPTDLSVAAPERPRTPQPKPQIVLTEDSTSDDLFDVDSDVEEGQKGVDQGNNAGATGVEGEDIWEGALPADDTGGLVVEVEQEQQVEVEEVETPFCISDTPSSIDEISEEHGKEAPQPGDILDQHMRDRQRQTEGEGKREVSVPVPKDMSKLKGETLQHRIPHEVLVASLTEALRPLGIPVIVSDQGEEAETCCVRLINSKQADAVLTDDADAVVMGGDVVVRWSEPDCYVSQDLKSVGLTPEVLSLIAAISGCDYSVGIPSIGPVAALELLTPYLTALPPTPKAQGQEHSTAVATQVLEGLQRWVSAKEREASREKNKPRKRKSRFKQEAKASEPPVHLLKHCIAGLSSVNPEAAGALCAPQGVKCPTLPCPPRPPALSIGQIRLAADLLSESGLDAGRIQGDLERCAKIYLDSRILRAPTFALQGSKITKRVQTCVTALQKHYASSIPAVPAKVIGYREHSEDSSIDFGSISE
ncbi:XPG/Rad2 endonuclease [Kipferlia bialata]|uniref:XPG/Rad2 endonuclease n=1 Tax=Kipferlia bialata TaxID=797122 RepID=A0A9K3CMC3_9EUKA|nr:XPG/Rad2 endonuclease [Kipferlia bialata]|eukprot:g435.t1